MEPRRSLVVLPPAAPPPAVEPSAPPAPADKPNPATEPPAAPTPDRNLGPSSQDFVGVTERLSKLEGVVNELLPEIKSLKTLASTLARASSAGDAASEAAAGGVGAEADAANASATAKDAKTVTLPNPGVTIELMPTGPHAGKLLRVEKDQPVSGAATADKKAGFRDEYALDDAAWDWWVKHQLPGLLKEQPQNFSDASWSKYKQP